MSDLSSNNKRIAKNTLALYVRTLFLMIISLYTSRVILDQLGVEDYGIYNVIGGVVAMFSGISSALSSSISRFITYELGHGDATKLKTIFSTSVNTQLGLAALILIISQIVGVWFVNYHLNIPADRLVAANWVLQCSLITFCINLISIPYNACIIAHEKMSAFAYISMFEAILKLLICYLMVISGFDKLIVYSVLMLLVAIVIRLEYGAYCSHKFEECHYQMYFDRRLLREMTGFAGWNFVTNTAWMFNTQGVSILVNIFYGVALNAARGIAFQVESAIMMFVRNLALALNPQITKYYASGQISEMFDLMCRGTKFTMYLTLIILLPFFLETEFVLQLWLKDVPSHTVAFVQLTLIGAAINNIGNTCYTACLATGNIKRYSQVVTSIGALVFPLTWLVFKQGFAVESMYIVYIVVYIAISLACMFMTRYLVKLPLSVFFNRALLPSITMTILSSIIPYIIYRQMDMGLLRFSVICAISVISSATIIYTLGLTTGERGMINNQINKIIRIK